METTLSLDSIAAYQRWLEETRGLSANTVKGYTSDIQWFFVDMKITTCSIDEALNQSTRWVNQYREVWSAKTTLRKLTSIKSFLGWAGVDRPLEGYRGPKPTRAIPHPLPGMKQDIKKLLIVARDDRQRALIAFCGLCGLRVAEALAVEIKDINAQDLVLHVYGKGARERNIPISTYAFQVMVPAILDARDAGRTRVLTYGDRAARQIITRLGERAGLARAISSHDLRATFATEAYNKNKDIRAVQELLGHANVEDTVVYTGVSMESMRLNADIMGYDEDDD